jgi:hypothetical protein
MIHRDLLSELSRLQAIFQTTRTQRLSYLGEDRTSASITALGSNFRTESKWYFLSANSIGSSAQIRRAGFQFYRMVAEPEGLRRPNSRKIAEPAPRQRCDNGRPTSPSRNVCKTSTASSLKLGSPFVLAARWVHRTTPSQFWALLLRVA